jgi:hypothetical protein
VTKSPVFIAVLACLTGSGVLLAAPNFSGEWKLNVAQSQYGPFPAPASMTRKVDHNGGLISMTTTQKGSQGDVTSELRYTIDGKPMTNTMPTGEVKGSARWDGDRLVIESSRQVNDAELKERDVWTLSADGKTLTIAVHITLPQQGEFDVKQVFQKQGQ